MMTLGKRPFSRLVCWAAACLLCLAAAAPAADDARPEPPPTALQDFMARPETVFGWEIEAVHRRDSGAVYDVALTSQQWQDTVWKHNLLIFEPRQVRHPRHVLLFITGGRNGRRPGNGELEMGSRLAEAAGARVAMLFQVPNQPLLGNRVEDDLITETWLRYLDTGDETWPLLFPMVKSAVKAMDAIQQIAASKWDQPVEGFVLTGGSKRGWTSWLTPAADPRVVATAPMVIDVLNFQPQMRHQLATWGKYSEQIIDYSSKGLINTSAEEETPREAHLRRMMDPYTYRAGLRLPKLLVNGTNDRYWVVDAMSLYWDDLVGEKFVLHVPNAGHGLDGGRELALSTVAAFFRHVAGNQPLPQLTWSHDKDQDRYLLKVKSSRAPRAARLWVARSETKDFRDARWEPRALDKNGSGYEGALDKPARGHVARFGELQFDIEGLPFSLCTLIQRD